MSQDLWGIVTGREQEPVDAENPMILSRFNARRERAFAIINLALTPTCRDCIRHLDTEDPKEAWRAVLARFEKETPETKMTLLHNLLLLRCEPRCTNRYLSEFYQLVARLKSLKVEIPEELLVALLLKGLPQSFDQFCKIIQMNREVLPLTEVIERLHNEEHVQSLTSTEDNVLAASDEQPTTRCRHCRRKGHFVKDCWKKHPELRPNRKGARNLKEHTSLVRGEFTDSDYAF